MADHPTCGHKHPGSKSGGLEHDWSIDEGRLARAASAFLTAFAGIRQRNSFANAWRGLRNQCARRHRRRAVRDGRRYLPGADSAARVASYVVSGVGFLGAGVIKRDGGNVRGLNTAATLWCAAAFGVLCGTGLQWQAAAGAAAVLGAKVVLRGIAHQISRQDVAAAIDIAQTYRVAVVCRSQEEVHARTLMLHMLNGMPQLMVQSLHREDLPVASKSART